MKARFQRARRPSDLRFRQIAKAVMAAATISLISWSPTLRARAANHALIVSSGPSNVHAVALTFDAGADRGYAARILRTLEAARIHASFGMTGLWAKDNPDLTRRIVRDGDQLINHTYDHRSFTGFSTNTAPLSMTQRIWEITHTAAIIWKLTRRSVVPWFRPPFGDYDAATLSLLARLGYRYQVMWTIDSLGWDHLPAYAIIQRCLSRVSNGAIILMHVGSQSQDALALNSIIKHLRSRGYRFLTVSALLSHH